MSILNWLHQDSQTQTAITTALTEVLFAPLPDTEIDYSVIEERIDRVFPKLLTIGHQDPHAIRWALRHADWGALTHGLNGAAHQTLMKVLNAVDHTGETVLSVALDRKAHWHDRKEAIEYLGTRNQQHLVEPLRDLLVNPYPGEIRAAALDAFVKCGIHDILPIVQEFSRYRTIEEDPTSLSNLTEISLCRSLWQDIRYWLREGFTLPEDWLYPWGKLLSARGQFGDITALRDLIILEGANNHLSDRGEGLDALINHMGGLEHAAAALCNDSSTETLEGHLLEVASHDTEEAVKQWADYQLAVMAPDKYAERSKPFLNQRANAWMHQAFHGWIASLNEHFSEVREAFFHSDQSVFGLTTDKAVGLFRRNSWTPYYDWSLPEDSSVTYLDFHTSKPLILVATGIQCNYETEGQVYLIDYAQNHVQPLLEASWRVEACWFLQDGHCHIIFGDQYEEDHNIYQADIQMKSDPQHIQHISPRHTMSYREWETKLYQQCETKLYQQCETKQSFKEWQDVYYNTKTQRVAIALQAWANNDQSVLNDYLKAQIRRVKAYSSVPST